MNFLNLLALLLIALKLTHVINISWVLVLSPLWGQLIFYIITSIIAEITIKSFTKKFKKEFIKDDEE